LYCSTIQESFRANWDIGSIVLGDNNIRIRVLSTILVYKLCTSIVYEYCTSIVIIVLGLISIASIYCKHIKTGKILLDISGKIIQTLQNNAQRTFLKRKIFLWIKLKSQVNKNEFN
jgi:hypothetical protein